MIETSSALFSLRKWFYEENYVKNQKVKRSLLCERGLGGVFPERLILSQRGHSDHAKP